MKLRAAIPADRTRWDAYVDGHPLTTPYHRFAWKDALENAYGVRTAYRLAEHDGQVVGVAPAARVPRPFGVGGLCSLPYCDRGEPLADDATTLDALVSKSMSEEGTSSTWEIRATATEDDRPPSEVPTSGGKVRMLLDLPDEAAELFDGFRAKHRSQIRKAGKNGLSVSFGNTPQRAANFYEVYARNMRDLGSPPHALNWFKAIAEAFADDCMIALVHYGDTIIGGGLVLRQGSLASIPWASTLRTHNRLAPNMLLYWEILARCIDQGCTRFDFGRSTLGEGTYRFKAQWGARAVPLHWYSARGNTRQSDSQTPEIGSLRTTLEAAWRHLPLPLTVAVGGRLRKYISL